VQNRHSLFTEFYTRHTMISVCSQSQCCGHRSLIELSSWLAGRIFDPPRNSVRGNMILFVCFGVVLRLSLFQVFPLSVSQTHLTERRPVSVESTAV